MDLGIGAARWAVGKALSPVTDGLLESWTASSMLGPNVQALTTELLFTQGMLNSARGRDMHNPALGKLLQQLQNLAYDADDVLDELEYFRIQDELEGTYETTDDDGGITLNLRHTARAITSKLNCSCLASGAHGTQEGGHNKDIDEEKEAGGGKAMAKIISSARRMSDALGKCIRCSFLSSDHDDAEASVTEDNSETREDAKQGCLWGGCSRGRPKPHEVISSSPQLPPIKDDDDDQEANNGCMAKIISNARSKGQAVGKCIPCSSLSSSHNDAKAKAQQNKNKSTPKLKFNRVEMSKKIVDIVNRLKPICARVATILDLELSGSGRNTSQPIGHLDRPKSTPEIIEPKLHGRDNLKEKVVHTIRDNASDLTVISMVGPGGIGKTTFTQHIYEEVKIQFDVLIWICVSTDFTVNRLRQEIIKQIPEVNEENKNASHEELIKKRLQSKKFLLVLDDIWKCNDDEWKKLLAPFKKAEPKGSIVIVTTRFPKIAEMVVTSRDYLVRLDRLENKDCMEFFEACVFGRQEAWKGDHASLEKVGKDIVDKLKGSPLAVKTVGRLLRNHLTLYYWNRVLESKEWELQTGDDDIMPALKLSYNYLHFDLQQCFHYCALFPEDYEFKRTELIQFWMGLGLLCPGDQNNRYEDIGEDYLNDLVGYGFFQMKEKEGVDPWYVIHDLLHELAVNVSSHECLIISGSNVRSTKVSPSIRHLSIIIDDTNVKDRITFDNYKQKLSIFGKRLRGENLRTLMLFGNHHGSFSKPLGNIFSNAKALRVIFLSNSYLSYNIECLLSNFSNLVHLRYLRIGHGGYWAASISLPSCISRFYHLMVLDLQHCNRICGSSRNFNDLLKIRHLLVNDEKFHSDIFEVGKLKSLQQLRKFEVQKEPKGYELKQLGELPQLNGSLEICNLERVESMKEVDEAKLAHMKHLHQLTLAWNHKMSNKDPKQEDDVLEGLKPPSELRKLCIKGHKGYTCPSWLSVDLSVGNLENLCLRDIDWEILPPVGDLWMVGKNGNENKCCITSEKFQKLKRIELVNVTRIKKWCASGTSNNLLALLEELYISGCPELVELSFLDSEYGPAVQGERMTSFLPKLRSMTIEDCPKLLSLPPIPCSNAMSYAFIWQVGTGIKELKYWKSEQSSGIRIEMENGAPDDSKLQKMLDFGNLREIDTFTIKKCPSVPLDNMQELASLKELNIVDCSSVLEPVEGGINTGYKFTAEKLSICDSGVNGKELTQFLSYFPSLRGLYLRNCQAVTQLGVAEKQESAIAAAATSSASNDETEDDERILQQQQEARSHEEIEAAEKGVLLLPTQIHGLSISGCKDLRLCYSSLDDGTTAGRGLHGLVSLRLLSIYGCPKFISSWSSSSCCPFPSSLQELYIQDLMEGTVTLAPLSNLTSLDIRDCDRVRGEDLWSLLAHDSLTNLVIKRSPNLFICSEPPRVTKTSRLSYLSTDDITGVHVPICTQLSSSLTELSIRDNKDMKRFTKEQDEAIQKLTSLQGLLIMDCKKLMYLPTGLSGLRSLKKVDISRCPAIRSLPKDSLPNSLMELEIWECPAFRSLPKGGLPSSLQTLEVCDSGNEELKSQCRKLIGTIPVVRV